MIDNNNVDVAVFGPKKGKMKKEFKQQHEKSIWVLFIQLNDNECVVSECVYAIMVFPFLPYVQKLAEFSNDAVA